MSEPITTTIALNIISTFVHELTKKSIKKLSSKSPIKKAILKTVDQFKDIENLEESLEKWLDMEEVHKEFYEFEKGNRDIPIGNLSKTMVEKVGFYYGVKSIEKAEKILNKFFSNLNEEYLKSEEAPIHLSRQSERIERELLARIDEKAEEEKGTIRQFTTEMDKKLSQMAMAKESEEKYEGLYAKRINEVKKLLDEGKVKTAKKLNLSILDDIKKEKTPSRQALFRIYTNLACCEWELGNNNKAIEYFEKAFDVLPEDRKARTNFGLSRMLKGNPKEGLQYIDEILKEDPKNLQARSVKAILLAEMGKTNEAISLFNEYCLLKLDSCLTFAQIFLNAKDFEKAKECLHRIKSHFKETPEVSFLYGQALSSPVLERIQNKQMISWLMDEKDWDALKEAHKSFSNAIRGFRSYEVNSKLKIALLNRSAVSIALSERKKAIQECDEILRIDEKYIPALNNKGIACLSAGDFGSAIESFQKALDVGGEPFDFVPKLCHAYLAKRVPQKVISVVSKYFPNEQDIMANLEIGFVLAEAYIFLKKHDEAESLIKSLKGKYGEESSVLCLSARLKKSLSNRKEAEQLLIRAIKKSKNGDRQRLILELADLYYETKEFSKALPLYKQVVKKDFLNNALERYVTSLYNSGQLEECFKLCSLIRQKYGVTQFISEVEATIQEELGNLLEAENLYNALSRKYPENPRFKMKLGIIYFRQRKEQQALSLLEEVKNGISDGTDLATIAQIYHVVGNIEEAIKIGYKALTLKPEDPRVHLAYIGLFFFMPDSEAQEFFTDKVSEDAVVRIRSDGQEEIWTLIPSNSADPTKGELPTLSGVGKALLGHGKGDVVEFESGIKTKIKYEILSVENKYVHKFREVLANFRTSFIEEKAIEKVEVGKDLKEIRNLVDQAERHQAAAIGFYRSRKLTMGALSKIVGKNLFEAWGGLISDPDLWIHCDSGLPRDQYQEQQLAATEQKITIDLLGVFTLTGLDRLDLLSKMFKNVYVSQSIKDEIADIERHLQTFAAKGYTTIFKRDGKYYREEITPETLEKNLIFIGKIQQFVKDNCEITGVHPTFSTQRRILTEIIGHSSADSIFVSKDRKTSLYSDDLFLRNLGQNDYGIRGFSSQSLLRAAFERDLLSRDEFHSAIEKLLLSDYKYVGISGEFLLYIAEKGSFDPSDKKMYRVLRNIELPETTSSSGLIVLGDFIKGIWISGLLLHTKQMYLDMTLQTLTKRRGIRVLLPRFREIIQIKCKLIPIQASEIMREIDKWEKSQLVIY